MGTGAFDAFDFGTLNLPHTYARLTYITRSIGSSRLTMLSGYASIIGYCSYPTKTKRISPSTFFHFENANVDPKFLTQQLQALLAKRDAKQLRKAYRVLQATLQP
jgi:hypothetical protein